MREVFSDASFADAARWFNGNAERITTAIFVALLTLMLNIYHHAAAIVDSRVLIWKIWDGANKGKQNKGAPFR